MARESFVLKFLHAADLHLDSPLRGLERYDGAPVEELRRATRQALDRLVELALGEQVQFVVLAGDIYDGDWDDHNTGLFFASRMARLRESEIPVYLIAGNHDAQSRMTKSVLLPRNVYVFPADRAETRLLEEHHVALHGQSFARPAVLDDLSAAYPPPMPGYFNIGVLHTCLAGREGHEPYAPTTVERLRSKGYDYWALGHVHVRDIACVDPYIVFPGNLQGRHVREEGAKGCILVRVDERRRVALDFRPLDVLRWHRIGVDAAGALTPEEVLDRALAAVEPIARGADGRLVAARIEVQGACPAHGPLLANPEHWEQQLRARLTDESVGRVWLERLRLGTRPPLDETEGSAEGPFGELDGVLAEMVAEDQSLANLSRCLDDLRRKLPAESRQGDLAVDLDSPQALRSLLIEARALLWDKLLRPGDRP